MSRSYKTEVSKPTIDQSPSKFKKQFNKKLRQNTKKTLDDYIAGSVKTTDTEFEQLYEENHDIT